jgi:hypothetical protein
MEWIIEGTNASIYVRLLRGLPRHTQQQIAPIRRETITGHPPKRTTLPFSQPQSNPSSIVVTAHGKQTTKLTSQPASAPHKRIHYTSYEKIQKSSTHMPTSAPPAYLWTVSRTIELSLQSSFQLSLTVLVRYRTRVICSLGWSLPPD